MHVITAMEGAVANAPLLGESTIGSVNDLQNCAPLGDDDIVHLNPEFYPDAPNAVSVDARREAGLDGLFRAFVDVTAVAVDQDYRVYARRHEDEHLEAANFLSAPSARLGLRVYNVLPPRSREPKLVVQSYVAIQNLVTTKLGAALIAAYPLPPSAGDHEDIEGYGYTGIDELAELAMRRNWLRRDRPAAQYYPVPLAYGSSPARTVFKMAA